MTLNEELARLGEKTVNSKDIFNGEILKVKKDNILLPNGKPASRELIRHVGAVCVIPVTEDGRVVMERQFRYPLNAVISEIPAGKLNSKTENPLEAAKRELLEETGITAEKWTEMGLYHPAPAYSDETITMYLAQKLSFGKQCLDDDEFLNIELVPLSKLTQQVLDGTITDGKTQVAVLKADKILNLE